MNIVGSIEEDRICSVYEQLHAAKEALCTAKYGGQLIGQYHCLITCKKFTKPSP